jgi:hypothetical protein
VLGVRREVAVHRLIAALMDAALGRLRARA